MKTRVSSTFLSFLSFLIPFLFVFPSAAADTIDVVKTETGFYYTIKKGDTLWDLSQHFNDSPWLWPELWEENDQIPNPHWIFPGERIRLYKKSGEQLITKKGNSEPVATPASTVPTPVPPSVSKPTTKKPASGPYFNFTAIDRVGFIRKPAVDALGTIFEVQGRKTLISEGDTVYIRPADDVAAGSLIPGSRHTVFKQMAPTDDRHAIETIGTQHYILGIVEVIKKEQGMVIAKIMKSFRSIRVNDHVMPFRPRHTKIELRPSTPGIDGQIIVSEDHSTLAGDYTLAFIDKGLADNIEIGQQYRIYREKKTTIENDEITIKTLPPLDFGTLLVLHTEETTSTVVITQATNHVSAGERFRTPVK